MQELDKREFLKLVSVGIAAAAGRPAAQAFGQMRHMGHGGTIARPDPPPGDLFRDPAWAEVREIAPGLLHLDLEARRAAVTVNGTTATLFTYNGFYPAPTIRVKAGDILRIHFKNGLPEMGENILGHHRLTNLHTHGFHVSPMGNSDNVMLELGSGDSFDYEYNLSKQYPGMLALYHPHYHGSVAEQYWGGMCGAIVVEDETPRLADYETHLLVLKDIALVGAEPEQHATLMDYMHGKEGNIAVVNGMVNPVMAIKPGQVQRWRILNASSARFYHLGLEGHFLHVIGSDSGLLDKPYRVSSMLLSPGERLDLLIQADQGTRDYKLVSLPYDRGMMGMMGMMGMGMGMGMGKRRGMGGGQQFTLMTLSYRGPAVKDRLPELIEPEARRSNVEPAVTRTIRLGMGHGRGYINGITFSHSEAFTIQSKLGSWEIWEVINDSGMDHPFHQHVNCCQVLSIEGGDPEYTALYSQAPAWKDTVLVPKSGSARLLVPVDDYPGMAMFHCHILEHEDIGMMGLWEIA